MQLTVKYMDAHMVQIAFMNFIVLNHPECITFGCFSHCHNKWSKIGTEAKFGGSVASMIWSERQAIETTTRIDISVRNYVVHA